MKVAEKKAKKQKPLLTDGLFSDMYSEQNSLATSNVFDYSNIG